jgi:uncharacterized protein (TIGR02646 family)
MRRFQRLPAPQFLTERWEQWGREWEQRRRENASAAFHWHRLDDEAVNDKLLGPLMAQVQDHCSFCDNFPVCPPSKDTIDHFRPKTLFPLLAYNWENLYYCCDFCQTKGNFFHDDLLQPDSPEYTFERFFLWDFTTGEILVNPLASPEDKRRAECTRTNYRLNEKHPRFRRMARRRRGRFNDDPLDDFAYRDFVSAPTEVQANCGL